MHLIAGRHRLSLSGWMPATRFVKFGAVGASGTLVNLAVLYLGQEHLFTALRSPDVRLNASLVLAVFCSTLHNFVLNRLWTWADRKQLLDNQLLIQFGQYALACWLGIALQVIFTKILAAHVHYLIANVTAIALAGLFNFLVNDFWTFGGLKLLSRREDAESPPGRLHYEPTPSGRAAAADSRLLLACYALATLLAVFTYFYGLDSQHIPKNGDEYPYSHITRLTAASGHLLPLQSQLNGMRNTKPPLLFWQGIVSTNWGKDWTLWHLRYPSVVYTLLTGGLVLLLGWKLSRQLWTGFLACLTFLAFFSTYRFGRPFLTNPPEVFWLFLPFFTLLYWQPASFESRFLLPILLGLGIGVGLLYKSFALALPVILGLAWWCWHHRHYNVRTFLARDACKIALTASIALAVFALWFLLDPDPHAIWKEFVLGENFGKFDPHGSGYLVKLLWGGSSIWSLALGYPVNAGLLAFPVMALFFVAYKRRGQLTEAEKLLWVWVLTLFLVFCLPSERSSRNLLAAMPALAVLCALNWSWISRKAFVASLIAAGAAVATMAYLSIRLQLGMPGLQLYPAAYWELLAATATFVLLALFVPRLTRPSINIAILLVYLSLAAFLRPLDGPLGSYSAEAQQRVSGRDVWVPCNFRAKDEGYRFLLPGAHIHGYREGNNQTVAALSAEYPLFAIRLPLEDTDVAGQQVIGQRLELRSRHSPREIKEMVLGRVFEYLFAKELLIEAAGPRSGVVVGRDEGCR